MQLNQMMSHCGIFRINYFLLVFIKPSARMANSVTFVLFGGLRGFLCMYCFFVSYFPRRYIKGMFQLPA